MPVSNFDSEQIPIMPTLNVHMLVYLQENMDKVKITKFDFDLMPETEDEEEITVLPVAVPGVAGPSK